MDEPIQTFGVNLPSGAILGYNHPALFIVEWLKKNITTQFQHTAPDGTRVSQPAFYIDCYPNFRRLIGNSEYKIRCWSSDDAKKVTNWISAWALAAQRTEMTSGPKSRNIAYYSHVTDNMEDLHRQHSISEINHWAEACAYLAILGNPDAFCYLKDTQNAAEDCVAYVMSFHALGSYFLRDDGRRASIAQYFLGITDNINAISISEECIESINNALGEGQWSAKTTELAWVDSSKMYPPTEYYILTIDLSNCGRDLTDAHARLTMFDVRNTFMQTIGA